MDIDFGDLIAAAGKVAGTVNNAVSAVTSLVKLAKSGKLPAEAVEEINALSVEVSEAKMKLTLLESEIANLQRTHVAAQKLHDRKRNFALSKTPMGLHVYRLKENADTDEPPHDVCPNCFERDRIAILQLRGVFLRCDACAANYQVAKVSNS